VTDRNDTVHYPRRPPLPEREPEQQPPKSRRRMVAILVAAAAASLGAGYASARWLGDSQQPARTPSASTVRTATTQTTALRRTPAGTLSPGRPAQPPAAVQPAPGAPAQPSVEPPAAPPAAATAPVAAPPAAQSASFDAPIPSAWREREFAVQKLGYLQSRWDDPRDPRTYVIVDWQDGDRGGAAAAAAKLRATVLDRPDYREVRFQRTSRKGWIWVYTIRDERGRRAARVDLLTRRCGVLFAVLGSTSPKRFAELQATFVAISRGIRLKQRRC
jgi:hypothetical protein